MPTSSLGPCLGWCALAKPGVGLGQGVGHTGFASGAARTEMWKSFGYPHPCLTAPPSCGPPPSSWEVAVSTGARGTALLLRRQLVHMALALAFRGLAQGARLRPQAQRGGCLAPLGRQVREGLRYGTTIGCYGQGCAVQHRC